MLFRSIGAGPQCDGQVLVTHDLLGLFDRFTPKFVRRYADLSATITQAVTAFREDVRRGRFPTAEQSFAIADEELAQLRNAAPSAASRRVPRTRPRALKAR